MRKNILFKISSYLMVAAVFAGSGAWVATTFAGSASTGVLPESSGGTGMTSLAARTISTTAPLTGGGNLGSNLTFAVSAASTTALGVVQRATNAEVKAKTDTTKYVSPASLGQIVLYDGARNTSSIQLSTTDLAKCNYIDVYIRFAGTSANYHSTSIVKIPVSDSSVYGLYTKFDGANADTASWTGYLASTGILYTNRIQGMIGTSYASKYGDANYGIYKVVGYV